MSEAKNERPAGNTQEHRLVFVDRLGDIDQERADLYGVLATLFAAPPSTKTLSILVDQNTDSHSAQNSASQTPIQSAWKELCVAASHYSEESCKFEYDQCFVGVGKPPVFLYISFFASGFLHEKPLAEIRQHLKELGIARKAGVTETEDHIASLCEVMRYLIMVEDLNKGNMETQKEFFQRHIASWFEPLADAIAACPSAHFYKHVADLMQAFFSVERLSYDYEA